MQENNSIYNFLGQIYFLFFFDKNVFLSFYSQNITNKKTLGTMILLKRISIANKALKGSMILNGLNKFPYKLRMHIIFCAFYLLN